MWDMCIVSNWRAVDESMKSATIDSWSSSVMALGIVLGLRITTREMGAGTIQRHLQLIDLV